MRLAFREPQLRIIGSGISTSHTYVRISELEFATSCPPSFGGSLKIYSRVSPTYHEVLGSLLPFPLFQPVAVA